MKKLQIILYAIATLLSLSIINQVKAQTPIVNPLSNGSYEVIKGDCLVNFNSSGDLTRGGKNCDDIDLFDAKKAIKSYLTEQQVHGSEHRGNSSNSQVNPYTTEDYDAVAYFKCSLGQPTQDKNCAGGILRGDSGSASIYVMFPNGKERIYNFNRDNVTSPNGGKLTWGKSGDEWYIGVDNQEFIIIPDAAIYGD